jgi:hypothetical protein
MRRFETLLADFVIKRGLIGLFMKEFTLAENLTSYKCLNCGKSFNHKVSLNDHMNNHLGIKEFYVLTVASSLFFG